MSILKSSVSCTAYKVEIFIAGHESVIVPALQEFCMKGLCVTLSKTTFVYTGAMEEGHVIGLINYARFPQEQETLLTIAIDLADHLMGRAFQRSCTVQTPTDSYYLTNKAYNKDKRD